MNGFYQSFIKVILKSGSAAGIIENLENATHATSSETLIRQLCPRASSKYRVGKSIMLEMWIFWDGRILNYGLAGRSQNVLFNLYLLGTKIEYKKSIFFIVTPCQI